MSDIKIHVPQIQIPAEAVRGLVDNLKTAQKAITPMGQRVAKVLDTQRQFFSQYQYVGFVKKSDLALTQQAPPKPTEPEQRKKASSQTNGKRKGGRPSNAEYDKICFAIIKMFLSFKINQTLNSISTLNDAADKINQQLKAMKSDVRIDVRRLDGDKIPGRLFRFLWKRAMGVYAWNYDEYKWSLDCKMVATYINKFSEAWDADERLKNRLNKLT